MRNLLVDPLRPIHDRDEFDCGAPLLNAYLQRRASQDVRRRVAQVFVATEPAFPRRIVGYYSLNAAGFDRTELPADDARRLPHYPVPAALLGRLAVSRNDQSCGVGEFLLLDALRRVLRVSTALAVHAVIVNAKDETAARFYTRYGFQPFPSDPLRMFLPLETIAKSGL